MTLVVLPHSTASQIDSFPSGSDQAPTSGAPKGPAATMPLMRHPVPPATLISSTTHLVPGQLLITELTFRVPLDYAHPGDEQITLFARRAQKHIRPLTKVDDDDGRDEENSKPYIVYLEGGPGFGNRGPQDHPLTRPAITRGYQVLMLDHRGTGMSTPVGAEMLARKSHEEQALYLTLMRQDNTVRDCEAVRKCLLQGQQGDKARWSIFGQSYGGFVAMSYLSMHPQGLKEVFLTGGLAPVQRNADEVYTAVWPRVAKRSEEYYQKYPEDVKNVWDIANFITRQGGTVTLPSGGVLTVPRLLTIGIAFGGHGGFDSVHNTILQLKNSLDTFGFLSRASLAPLESYTPFDTNIIYAILHEAIYCNGPGYASSWASQRIGEQHPSYQWLKRAALSPSDGPLHFSGENIFPFDFETYPELRPLQAAAEILAMHDEWEYLYDLEQLSRNEVPVYAASYVDDMYVDSDLARETARLVKGTRVFETNVMYHNALRAKAEEVLQQLFNLRDDVLD